MYFISLSDGYSEGSLNSLGEFNTNGENTGERQHVIIFAKSPSRD